MECEDVPEGREFETDTFIARWAIDPSGRRCLISAELPELPSPMFKSGKGDDLGARVLAWGANRWLESVIGRSQRNHTGPPIWYLEVCVPGRHHTVLAEEEVVGREEAQRRVSELVEQVVSGNVRGAT